ncbi:MAG: hypothetical protein IJF63_05200 [Alistipes sp.]|nr:hypothetical protein [Alistipes sp.]
MKENKKNRKEEGYISFDPEELKNATQEGDPNDEAYELLWEATCVSSHVKDADKECGHTDIDNVYPTTAEEVDRMEELINKAEAALKEPNSEFNSRVAELRAIVEWSRKRHWKLNWRVIVGVLLSVFILQMCVDNKQGDVKKAEDKLEQVKNWQEEPLNRLNLDSLKEQPFVICDNPFASLKVWYDREQRNVAHDYHTAVASIAYNEENLKNPDINNTLEDFYKDQIKSNKKKMKESYKRFEKLQKADFKDVQEMALEEVEGLVDQKASDANFVKFWNLFFLLLIPVYIFAARPRGYTISRHRREADNLGTIEKIGLWLSGGLLTAGMGIGFVNIVTKWSDGSTTSEDDGTGPARLAMKLGLFVAAALVFCAVSCFLMLYATIAGLIRNYDWTNIKNKAVAAGAAAKEQYNKR